MDKTKHICPICNGSGQDPHFKGESRFLLSWEDCAECGGMGFIIRDDQGSGSDSPERRNDEA